MEAQSQIAASPAVDLSAPEPQRVTWADFAEVTALLLSFGAGLIAVRVLTTGPKPPATLLLGPVFAAVALTAMVWLLMLIARNTAVIRGLASPEYYVAYTSQPPTEWIERPARTFNNLMQVPTLFYTACILMLVTQTFDRAQLIYAWIFVATRVVHACVYIGWNYVPYRFASFVASSIVLGTIWLRLALQTYP